MRCCIGVIRSTGLVSPRDNRTCPTRTPEVKRTQVCPLFVFHRSLAPRPPVTRVSQTLKHWGALMRLGLVASLLCLCTVSLCLADPAKAAIRKDLNVPAEDLSPALQQVATTYELQVLYPTQVAKDLKTHGAVGALTSDEALNAVLSGTGLSFKYLDANTVTVFATAAPAGTSTAASQDRTNNTQDNSKEAGKKSSQDFRVAQVDQRKATGDVSVEVPSGQEAKQKAFVVEEVVVTGSRIPTTTKEGPQDVKIYTRENIEQSGQTNVADFLNTLPSIAVASTEVLSQYSFGDTTVQLHGLPAGTTLLLINGRRVETSGTDSTQDFFNLNNIPLAAVDRIEVVADGSSAIYGSDAIAGVVNVILRTNFNGFQVETKNGHARGIDEWDTSLTWGKRWDVGSISIVGSYQTRGELTTADRSLTASNDYTAYGGPNNNFPECNPGNIFSVTGGNLPGLNAPYAAVPAGYTGKPTIQEFLPTAGRLNQCGLFTGVSLIPATDRAGVFIQGAFKLTPAVELFTELLYSHVQQYQYSVYQGLFGQQGFQQFTVSAANPYNPFGTTVGVADLFTSLPRVGTFATTEFFRPLVGARGGFWNSWNWEISAWQSEDSTRDPEQLQNANNTAIQNALNSPDPATALNPFIAGAPGSYAELSSFFSPGLITYKGTQQAINAFMHGPTFRLPSGPIEVLIGSEFNRDKLISDYVSVSFEPPNTRAEYHRDAYALFGEARVPILGNQTNPEGGNRLTVTVAGRHDHYSDFGSKNTPQFGIEWRPFESLLIRGTYAEAFKAPPLPALHAPGNQVPIIVTDPLTGQQPQVTLVTGGNPNLLPETGQSHTVGFVYTSKTIPNLQVSITNWRVTEHATIQSVPSQVLINNESLFPGDVIRNASGVITEVIDEPVNFGTFDVAGLDYHLGYAYDTRFGTLTTFLNATQTYRYLAALTPGGAPVDGVSKAQDTGDWAPRWKGTVAVGWKVGSFTAGVDGRYVGRYQDYDSTREIGNFWLVDVDFGYNIGQAIEADNRWLKGLYLGVGAVNLLDRQPQFSNYYFDYYGYDASQADIRGRFVYAKLGIKW
jgi:iron complex outermembrane receptor protein